MVGKNGFIAPGIPNKPFRKTGCVYATRYGWVWEREICGNVLIEKLTHFRYLDDLLEKGGFDVYGEPLDVEQELIGIIEQELKTEYDKNFLKHIEKELGLYEHPVEIDVVEIAEEPMIIEDIIEPYEYNKSVVEQEITFENPVVCNKAETYGCTIDMCEHSIIHEKGDCGAWHTCDKIDGEEPFKTRCQKV